MADGVEKLLEYGRMGLEAGYLKYAHDCFEQVLALDATNQEAPVALVEIEAALARRASIESTKTVESASDGIRHREEMATDKIESIKSQFQMLLSRREYSTVLQKLETYRVLWSYTRYAHKYDQLMQEILAQIRTEIEEALKLCAFERANRLYAELEANYPDATTQDFEDRIRRAREMFDSLEGKLRRFYFTAADELFRETHYFAREKYEDLKKDYIEQYVNEHLPSFPINDEQAKALANTSDNLLVGARAGSGKTRLIAYKTALLLQEGVQNPDGIMILAFNVRSSLFSWEGQKQADEHVGGGIESPEASQLLPRSS